MRYAKALIASIIAALGSVTVALETPGFTGVEIITAAATFLLAIGGTLGVPNAGFLDLSKLTPAQRAQLNQFLNLS